MRTTLQKLFGIDPRSLAAFRIGLALVMLAELASRARTLGAHYTRDGVMPADVLREMTNVPLLSLHLLGDSWGFQAGLFLLSGLFGLMMLVGWHTRWATVLCLALTYSLHVRNPLTVQHSDLMLYAMLLWAAFLPLGGFASIDVRRARTRQSTRVVFRVASVALVLQGVFVYLVAAVSKTQYASWQEGRALFTVLNKTGVARALGEHLLDFPDLLQVLTYAVLATELAIAPLALSPWYTARLRGLAILLAIALQAGIFVLLDLGLFQPIACVLVIPWLPAQFWERFTRFRLPRARAAERPGVRRWIGEAGAGALLTLVVLYNVLALFPSYPRPPAAIHAAGIALRLDQSWRMFSNTDGSPQGWFIVAGRTADRRVFDILTGRPEVSSAPPSRAAWSQAVPNSAWMVYWRQIRAPRFAALKPHLADYFCRRWNGSAEPRSKIVQIEIVYMAKQHYDPALPPRLEPRTLIRKACPAG